VYMLGFVVIARHFKLKKFDPALCFEKLKNKFEELNGFNFEL
jgi:hypothetical protein